MVFDITCKNGHDVQIIPELIDETQEKYSTNNFMLNYKLLLLMQLLGKGLKSIAIVTALLGMRVTIGNYAIWKKMLNQLGEIQTKLAKNCCKENLQKEIDATIAKGNYETCGNRVGIVVVMLGGRGVDLETHITVFLATRYLLVGTQNWFLHSNFSQNSVKHAIHLKRKMELISMTQHIQSTDVQETGQKAPKQWSREELLNVQL